jgi:hypothetical protein
VDAGERKQRLIEAAVALLSETPKRELKIVLLNKALFYLDLVALRDLGRTLSGATFLALEQGPVVADYPRRLIRSLEAAGLAEQGADGMSKPVRLKKSLARFDYMDSKARALAKLVVEHIARLTSSQASRISHGNPGWALAYERGMKKGGGPAKINMLVALQELGGPDPWLQLAPTVSEEAVFAAADGEQGESW